MNDDFPLWQKVLWAFLATFLLFLLGDCVAGQKLKTNGIVQEHQYHPSYTTVSCSTTTTGKSSHTECHPVFHPERFILIIGIPELQTGMSQDVGVSQYTALKDGASVVLDYSKGRYTGYTYCCWMD